jgi:hypothetical protein
MIMLIIRFLLSLSIFLLSGHNYLSAHTDKESIFLTAIQELEGSVNMHFDAVYHDPKLIIKGATSGTEKGDLILEVSVVEINEEKDEWLSNKKYVESSNFFTTLFYLQLPEYSSEYTKSYWSFYKQISNYLSSEPRYLLFRVLRL